MKKTEMIGRKSKPAGKFPLFTPPWKTGGHAGFVTYSMTMAESFADEQRGEQRRRTRLRAGKILDRANHFLVDATILDRSCAGLRLRLAQDVEAPDPFHFFDDEIESIYLARIAWRNQQIIGVRRGPLVAATPRQIASLRGKFYAIPD